MRGVQSGNRFGSQSKRVGVDILVVHQDIKGRKEREIKMTPSETRAIERKIFNASPSLT